MTRMIFLRSTILRLAKPKLRYSEKRSHMSKTNGRLVIAINSH